MMRKIYKEFMAGLTIVGLARKHGKTVTDIEFIIRKFSKGLK